MSKVRVVPLTPTVGAEIHGIDLSQALPEAHVHTVRSALLEHAVVFFRDQEMTPEQHMAFARQFGELSRAPFGPMHPDYPVMMVLDQNNPKGAGGDRWHTDNTFMETPPMGSILRAVQLPSSGGDTCFASMYAAYEALSEPMKRFLEGLRAEHDLTQMLSLTIRRGKNGGAELAKMQRDWPPMEHPVIRTHPESGRKALFVNGNFTTRIVGLTVTESDALLRLLLEHVSSPAFQCRFHWEPGSVAFWDNRAALHYAVPDYSDRRLMHRVTLEGDQPF